MTDIYPFIIIYVLSAAAVAALIYISGDIRRRFNSGIKAGAAMDTADETDILNESDIYGLPGSVQKYIRYTGALGKAKVRNVRTLSETDIDLGNGKGRAIMSTDECNFFNGQPSRLSYMKFKLKGLPVFGLDTYINGKGGMLMKPLGLFSAVDARGHVEDDTSAEAMMLLMMCTAAPAALIDKRIEWTECDGASVIATFDDGLNKVSAALTFAETGELVRFSTEDKYYAPDGKTYQKVRWSTPVSDYRDIDGMKLSTYGEAIWHFADGDRSYGKSMLKKLEYNITGE